MAQRNDPIKRAVAREAFASLVNAHEIEVEGIGILDCLTKQEDFYTLFVNVVNTVGKRRTFVVAVKEMIW